MASAGFAAHFFLLLLIVMLLLSSPHYTPLFGLSGAVATSAAEAPELGREPRALLAWKASLRRHGPALLSWLPSSGAAASPCTWSGVVCSQKTRGANFSSTRRGEHGGGVAVTEISLPHAGLVGTLDALDLSALPSLERVNLRRNALYGALPRSIGDLHNLTSLDLSNNWLSGELPLSWANLSRITELDLAFNQITGRLFPILFTNWSSSLVSLRLGHNNIVGPIPSEVVSLASLQFLSLNENQLSGKIPGEIGSLKNLNKLYLDHNNLSASIPSSMGNLTRLTSLTLWQNRLSGRLPLWLGKFSLLRKLELSSNQFTGELNPQLFVNCTRLSYFSVFDNQMGCPSLWR